MDGYAVREADLRALPARLRITASSFAGNAAPGRLGPGECARIFTGGPLPDGADRVVVQEEVRADGEYAWFEQKLSAGRHIRRRGSDFTCAEVLLEAGRRLDPRALVAAAAADPTSLTVWRRPRLAILATGDELVEPGTAAERPGAIPDSVSAALAALAGSSGAIVTSARLLGDDLALLERAAADALGRADLVLVVGGASVGARDFGKAMFDPAGLELCFSKVSIKPGKPLWLGRAAGRIVLGLPGNPTSALVTARLFLVPLVIGLGGGDAAAAVRWKPAELAGPIEACGGRETFYRGRWREGRVEPLPNQDSGAQKALAAAELLLRRRAGAPAGIAGETVEILDF